MSTSAMARTPRWASAVATARPMPLAAPVMTATLPPNSMISPGKPLCAVHHCSRSRALRNRPGYRSHAGPATVTLQRNVRARSRIGPMARGVPAFQSSGFWSGGRPSTISTARRANAGPRRPAEAASAAAALPPAARAAMPSKITANRNSANAKWKGCARSAAPGRNVVALEIGGLVRYSQGRAVESEHAPVLGRQGPPRHRVEGHVGERVPERRQFPVQYGYHPRLGRMEHQVAHPEVAVADRHLLAFGKMGRQPLDQPVEPGVWAGPAHLPLPRPARDLAGEVVARLAEVLEPDRRRVDPMQARHRRPPSTRTSPAARRGRSRAARIGRRRGPEPVPSRRTACRRRRVRHETAPCGAREHRSRRAPPSRGTRGPPHARRAAVHPQAACAAPASDRRSRRSTSDSTGRRRSA